jgi:hypothetical protein
MRMFENRDLKRILLTETEKESKKRLEKTPYSVTS